MRWDPYTLLITLDDKQKAEGELYIDDGESFDYKSGAYIHRHFDFTDGVLTSVAMPNPQAGTKAAKEYLKSMKQVHVERIIVVNAQPAWKEKTQVEVTEGGKGRTAEMQFFEGKGEGADWAVVKNPGMGIGVDWAMRF